MTSKQTPREIEQEDQDMVDFIRKTHREWVRKQGLILVTMSALAGLSLGVFAGLRFVVGVPQSWALAGEVVTILGGYAILRRRYP